MSHRFPLLACAGARHVTFALIIALTAPGMARADVTLPALFTDHMVLQQGKRVAVWGWADNGEVVTVTFGTQTVKTTARDGTWKVELAPLRASDVAERLVVIGKNRLEVNDVLVGEVWIASGQSNMEFPMRMSSAADTDIPAANSSRLRLFTVTRSKQNAPVHDVKGAWSYSTPQSVKDFSAVAYYFGKDLQETLDVPVGIIHTSWGGSPADVWMSNDALAANAEYQRAILDGYQTRRKNFETALANWKTAKAAADAAGTEFKDREPQPNWKPSELYNGMIAPLIPFAITGAIWYQGESNAGRAYQYRSLMADLIRNWRRDWGQGDFTFLQVQLAPWDKGKKRSLEEIASVPVESDWAELRDAQVHVSRVLPHVGVVVIADVGDKDNLHPPRKKPIGQRLALAAEAIAYGKKVEFSGPMYKSVTFDDGKAVISFEHSAKGLTIGKSSADIAVASDTLTGFAIAGDDRKFYWASAAIRGTTVVVSSPNVPKPVAVRYGWADFPVVNLYHGVGLPASPFRTDDWPGVTWPK